MIQLRNRYTLNNNKSNWDSQRFIIDDKSLDGFIDEGGAC